MSKNRRDEEYREARSAANRESVIESRVKPDLRQPFNGPFRCVGMARTVEGFVTVTVDFGLDGLITAMTLGRPQSAPHGQPYVAGEAKRILLQQCLGV